jgi:putative endonuclease
MTIPPRSMDPRQAAGLLGERIAARWLARRGWMVVAHRFRSGHRDLDLVVRQERVVAFVEVKARRGLGFGDPIEAVRWRKQRELVRSANAWIARHGRAGDTYRFDVVGVLLPPLGAGDRSSARVRIRHVADAFQVPSRA